MSTSLRSPDELAQWLGSVGLEQIEESNRAHALAAAYLFARGVVSRGKGAKLAGVPIYDFELLVSRLHIPVLDLDEEEWAAEDKAVDEWLNAPGSA